MPANLTPEYRQAEDRFKGAKSDEEKYACLEEMMRVIPKHKGTEKMRADIKSRMAKLRARLQSPRKSAGARRSAQDHVEKEGAAQIALLGPPNCGKSTLLAKLTQATPKIADYPYTTQIPQPGMMIAGTVPLQLVDLPPISSEFYLNWMTNVIRCADVLVLMADLGAADMLEGIDAVVSRLDELLMILTRKEIPETHIGSPFCKRAFILANKCDAPTAADHLDVLEELFGDRFDILPASCRDSTGLDAFQAHILDMLQIMRIYTKSPGDEPDFTDPIILPIGATVSDAARIIHKDFARDLQFAKVWGTGKFDGQRVSGTFTLADKDIIEFHT